VRDFPADGERLTAAEPVGDRHVLVNGTPIRCDEVRLDRLDPASNRRWIDDAGPSRSGFLDHRPRFLNAGKEATP
jgi:hypothetical protein